MIYLADTNVLLRVANRSEPLHDTVRTAIRNLRGSGHQMHVASQNLVEFWNVMTRPTKNNGFGFSPVETDRFLRIVERVFPIIPDSPATYGEWRKLVVQFGVSGVQVHDARLVATMIANGITHILTLNAADFSRYSQLGIVAVDPSSIP